MGVYIGHTSKYSHWGKLHICSERRSVRRVLGTTPKLAVGVDRWTCQTFIVNDGPSGVARRTVRRVELLCPLS